MKYNITYRCGHEGEIELLGKTSERERKIHYLETECDCPECQKKAQAEYTAKIENKYNLPELEGSPKQVAWARDIRACLIGGLAKYETNAFAEAQQMLSGNFTELRVYKNMVERKGLTPEAATACLETATRMIVDAEFAMQVRTGAVKLPEGLEANIRNLGWSSNYCLQVLAAMTQTSAKWFIDCPTNKIYCV